MYEDVHTYLYFTRGTIFYVLFFSVFVEHYHSLHLLLFLSLSSFFVLLNSSIYSVLPLLYPSPDESIVSLACDPLSFIVYQAYLLLFHCPHLFFNYFFWFFLSLLTFANFTFFFSLDIYVLLFYPPLFSFLFFRSYFDYFKFTSS